MQWEAMILSMVGPMCALFLKGLRAVLYYRLIEELSSKLSSFFTQETENISKIWKFNRGQNSRNAYLDRWQWKRDVAKKIEFQRYPPKHFCTARYEHKSWKKKFQTFEKPRKK